MCIRDSQRIVNQMLPDEPGTKVNQCVDNIMQIWRDGKADKLTQLVFCDISTDVYKRQQQDHDLLRFHYHRPREIWENLKVLDLPRRTFSSDISQVPTCLLYTSRCV